jgi:hypothetical protein
VVGLAARWGCFLDSGGLVMKFHMGVVAVVAALLTANGAQAVVLFEEDFQVDPSSEWSMFTASGADPTDSSANYSFDYSTVGIPLAPNSVPASPTRGLNLQTQINNSGLPSFQGVSVSPTGLDVSSNASYKMTFDWWANYMLNAADTSVTNTGTTMLSTYGIGTTGTAVQFPGSHNSLSFSMTLDGGSAADWRVYSPSAGGIFSYQEPNPTAVPPIPDGTSIYASKAGTGTVRNNSNTYYANAPEFAATSPPAAQIALFPQQAACPLEGCTPVTSTLAGTVGFKWREVEIVKEGEIITWTVDGVLIATVDMNNEEIGDTFTLPGGNVFFGHSDTNGSASNDPNRTSLNFSLYDNIKVETLDAVINTADFNDDGTIDAADYTVWRDNLGLTGTATQLTGDANGDLNVDNTDYDLWKAAFGTSPGSGSLAAVGVPEPGTALLALVGVAGLIGGRRRGAR